MKMIYFLIFITLLFIIYSEYSVGHILFRPDSLGKISMNVCSLLGFLMNPFHSKHLWTWETLDINYAFVMISSLLLFTLFQYSPFNILFNVDPDICI
jgi:hypothetical protein